MGEKSVEEDAVPRRTFLKLGATGGAIVALGTAGSALVPDLRRRGLLSLDGVFDAASMAFADSLYIEAFPTRPLILNAVHRPAADPAGAGADARSVFGAGRAARAGRRSAELVRQRDATSSGRTPSGSRTRSSTSSSCRSTHSFTISQVLPINSLGQPTKSFDASGNTYPAGTVRTLPPSTIYGFNGTFPGPMINAEYGKPGAGPVREPPGREPARTSTGRTSARPDYSFLTHLHNGAHRARVRRQPALLDTCSGRSTRATGQVRLWTTCT